MKLSIIIPVYNEEKTIIEILKKIENVRHIKKQIIVIDDKSDDRSFELIDSFNFESEFKIIRHDKNSGKGSCIKSAKNFISGDIVIIQDADLEYDPTDYDKLLKPFFKTNADVVYGSRFRGGSYVRLHFFWHSFANKLLTLVSNIVTNLNMTDMETGFKVFKSEVIKSINLKEDSFGIEPEITIKLAKKKFKFYEVAVSYRGRSYSEGKKITLKDAFWAVYCILRYRFFD